MKTSATAFRRKRLHLLLSKERHRDIAREEVFKLYSLLPGPTAPCSAEKIPEVEVSFETFSATRETLLKSKFLSKSLAFKGQDTRGAAIKKFRLYEERCERSNTTFRAWRDGAHCDPDVFAIISMAQRKIAQVLGKFRFDRLYALSRWGPGSTSSCKGLSVSAPKKFRARADCTIEFLDRARLLLPLYPSWSALLTDQDYGVMVNPTYTIIKGNKITFVKKTSVIDRAIAVEPHINVFFQNGMGQMIRERMLTNAYVNLNDQTLNRKLAKLGSIDDSLATIDLEGASDTICIELVRELLPEDWFYWLNAARSHVGELDGKLFRYHKFSSMGNGATFDLESLIFWALSTSATEYSGYNPFWVNTFGDDIIVPSGCYDLVTKVLTSVGFLVNTTKSFHKGPFRESCGTDWYRGQLVRPVYSKELPVRVIDWIKLANKIRRLSHTWGDGYACNAKLRTAYDYCLSRIPLEIRERYSVPFASDGFGSVGDYDSLGLIRNFDEACPPRAPDGWDGYLVKAIQTKVKTAREDDRSLVTGGIYQISEFGNDLPLRDLSTFREGALFCQEWQDIGPWGQFLD